MNPTTIDIVRAASVATVWLARPEVRNAFNETMVAQLSSAFNALNADPNVRVIVLAAKEKKGETGSAFCAGADLDWMRRVSQYTEEQNRADALALAHMLHALYRCGKPVIARVQGDAFAGGVGLVAACDIAVASTSAHFCLSEVKLGLIPATISPYVIRAMGERAARRYCLSAEKFDAQEAWRLGLVHEVVAPEALDACVQEIQQALLQASPTALAQTKQLLHDVAGTSLDQALMNDTAQRIAHARRSEDGQEGIAAFLEKRKPRWQ